MPAFRPSSALSRTAAASSNPMRDVVWYQLRETRADPPGRARADDERRRVYGAALDQFEELMNAASMTSARSAPLALYSAITQAGLAIEAAHADREGPRGHGLR